MKRTFKALTALILILLSPSTASAICCIPQEAEVVGAATAVIVALKQYNSEMDKSLDKSRSATQAIMAQIIEKQKIINELYILKRNTELRADVKAAIIQQILLRNKALLFNISEKYNKTTATELEDLEKPR